MTLVVSAFWRDPATGESKEFIDWDEGRHMAGVEKARWDLWGSEPVRRRGARFLPNLSESDLWVESSELNGFEAEVRLLIADVDSLRVELGRGQDCLMTHYLANFLRQIEFARARDGGVHIS